MWLSNSSVGRKVVMSVTGIAQELTNQVVTLSRDDRNKVHRHVKRQKQDKGDTCDTHPLSFQ